MDLQVVATNSTGFTALPGGSRTIDGELNSLGKISRYWASDRPGFPDYAYRLTIPYYTAATPTSASSPMGNGLSIRCLKDN